MDVFKFDSLALNRPAQDRFHRVKGVNLSKSLKWIVNRAYQNLCRIEHIFPGENSGEPFISFGQLSVAEVETLANWVFQLERDFMSKAKAIADSGDTVGVDHEYLSTEIPGFEHAFREIKNHAKFNDSLKIEVLSITDVGENVTVPAAICSYSLAKIDIRICQLREGNYDEAATSLLDGTGAYACGESFYSGSMGYAFNRLDFSRRGKQAGGKVRKSYRPLNIRFWELCDSYKGKLTANHAGEKFAPEIEELARKLGIKRRGESIAGTLSKWYRDSNKVSLSGD